jgi:hypothetical protein
METYLLVRMTITSGRAAYTNFCRRPTDKRVATMRNIRTKAPMHRVHHCEDPECGGTAPKLKCVHKLHFAWCLAPVVDEDPESPTFDEVVSTLVASVYK